MDKAFVDTTVLTNILLKKGDIQKTSKNVLLRFNKTYLPVYAIKEFKAGPLKNYIYAHNKLATTGSFKETITAFQKLSGTPQRYKTSTSLEALAVAQSSIANKTLKDWVAKYGENANPDIVQCDECRLSIKVKIFIAWKKRRAMFDETVFPLSCYKEVAPYEKYNLIEGNPYKCQTNEACSVKSLMAESPENLKKIKSAISVDSKKNEDIKRRTVLKRIIKHPNSELTDQECRNLGDAVFACLAPADAVILTTNVKDHKPLANALGKIVESP